MRRRRLYMDYMPVQRYVFRKAWKQMPRAKRSLCMDYKTVSQLQNHTAHKLLHFLNKYQYMNYRTHYNERRHNTKKDDRRRHRRLREMRSIWDILPGDNTYTAGDNIRSPKR